MFGTKLEVNMRKAEPGLWQKLNLPRATADVEAAVAQVKPIGLSEQTSSIGPGRDEGQLNKDFDAVDLSDL